MTPVVDFGILDSRAATRAATHHGAHNMSYTLVKTLDIAIAANLHQPVDAHTIAEAHIAAAAESWASAEGGDLLIVRTQADVETAMRTWDIRPGEVTRPDEDLVSDWIEIAAAIAAAQTPTR